MCLLSTCILSVVCVVFFFKQKTAYEMRISDWSSDVCSSDLFGAENVANRHLVVKEEARPINGAPRLIVGSKPVDGGYFIFTPNELRQARERTACIDAFVRPFIGAKEFLNGGTRRSEEHTSELQSLMRSSYAVFCLKKKKNTNTYHNQHTN